MRVRFLNTTFLGLNPFQHTCGVTRTLAPRPQTWASVATRLPTGSFTEVVTAGRGPLTAPTLDRGFFFPTSHPWIGGTRALKKFYLSTQEARPLTTNQIRASALWEVIDGADLNTSHLRPQVAEIGYHTSPEPRLYRGLRFVPNQVKSANNYQFGYTPSILPLSYRLGKTPGVSLNPHPQAVEASFLLNSYKNATAPSYLGQLQLDSRAVATFPRVLNGRQTPVRAVKPIRLKTKKYPILQVRYKPGLAKAWRLLRMQFCLAWGLPWLRQRRFTNYVSNLNGVTGFSFLMMCVHSIGAVGRASGLAGLGPRLNDEVFVNGVRVVNPLYQVYKGDRVSVLKAPHLRSDRLGKVTDVVLTPPMRGWEVDGMTSSVTILYEPSFAELSRMRITKPLPHLTFRMYNWKYRH